VGADRFALHPIQTRSEWKGRNERAGSACLVVSSILRIVERAHWESWNCMAPDVSEDHGLQKVPGCRRFCHLSFAGISVHLFNELSNLCSSEPTIDKKTRQ
jgi:hypothetical protein